MVMLISAISISLYADIRDCCYNYKGIWKIESCFSVDGILEEYLNDYEAEGYIGEIIHYKDVEYIFKEKKYTIRSIDSNYYTSEQLRESTRGSGTPGYDFHELKIINQDIIRDVWFEIVEEWGFGNWLYVLDDNKIIIRYKGYFFLANRIE
jgi:hypothetical protein